MEFRIDFGCKRCAIAYNDQNKFTGICKQKNGGCGCVAGSKASDKGAKCPEGVWANNWLKEERLIEINKDRDFESPIPIDEPTKKII